MPGSTSEAVLQSKPNPKLLQRNQTPQKKIFFLINLQIRTTVRRNEDPSPGSPSRRRRLCSSWSCLLDVRGRRIIGNPTTVAWGDVGAARGLRTKVGAASSSTSSSSTILTSRRRLGARLSKVDLWPIIGPAAAPVGDGSIAIGLLPATLSSVVGADRFSPWSLLVYPSNQAASSAGGSIPAGCSILGASNTYTVARSTSLTYNKSTTSY